MQATTAELWVKQDQHPGDRLRLFSAVAGFVEASSVLYPGAYVDIAPSFVFPSVTYVDTDRRSEQFFADADGVGEIIAANAIDNRPRSATFLRGDYRDDLSLKEQSFHLLASLYAGFVSEHCTRYLRIGGSLLVNSSHGDAAMASIDSRYELSAVVRSRKGRYLVDNDNLSGYMIPKNPMTITREVLHELGRGVAYTKSPFAYIFRRVR